MRLNTSLFDIAPCRRWLRREHASLTCLHRVAFVRASHYFGNASVQTDGKPFDLMATTQDFAHTCLRQLGLWFGLMLFLALANASAVPIERFDAFHSAMHPLVLHVAAPRLTFIKSARPSNDSHSPSALSPTLASPPAAPRSAAASFPPANVHWHVASLTTGWHARAPPVLTLQSTI